jgi:hypothetical protein
MEVNMQTWTNSEPQENPLNYFDHVKISILQMIEAKVVSKKDTFEKITCSCSLKQNR